MAAENTRPDRRDHFALLGTTLEAKYRIDHIVAEGGFGVVYEGYHRTLQVPIAIKVLKTLSSLPEDSRADYSESFVREAQTIARMKHPNIVQVLDVGVSTMPNNETAPWMVLEWLTGKTLHHELRDRRGFGGRPPSEALGMFYPILDAVAFAHDEGIAHRDLKPRNIMLVPTRRGVTPKVLDFGIAKAMSQDEDASTGVTSTRSAMLAFSPHYAAPEQLAATRTGPWTDVHALALIFTEILTDKQPLDAKEKADLYSRALSPERPTPAKLGFDVGPLEPVLKKALAFRPSDRYRNAGEFLAALEETIGMRDVRRSLMPQAEREARVGSSNEIELLDAEEEETSGLRDSDAVAKARTRAAASAALATEVDAHPAGARRENRPQSRRLLLGAALALSFVVVASLAWTISARSHAAPAAATVPAFTPPSPAGRSIDHGVATSPEPAVAIQPAATVTVAATQGPAAPHSVTAVPDNPPPHAPVASHPRTAPAHRAPAARRRPQPTQRTDDDFRPR